MEPWKYVLAILITMFALLYLIGIIFMGVSILRDTPRAAWSKRRDDWTTTRWGYTVMVLINALCWPYVAVMVMRNK